MIGKAVSHYKILERLGEGGMGVVYKAEDPRLTRSVALKFLPPHLTSDEKNRRSFVQEARAASVLNHPNICTVHDIGEENGLHFIVMELVEGQTLREILDERGPLPENEAIEIAIGVSEALAAAHEAGIIHRDIKPDNIMITPRGLVKVMDFGLAKAHGPELNKQVTGTGTVAYMSPEQAEVKPLDGRTDLWALGVVLYEMLSGDLPFSGDASQAILYSISHEDPESISSIRAGVSSQLERIVQKAIAKDPAERFQSGSELGEGLRRLRSDSTKQKASRWMAHGAGLVIAGAVLFFFYQAYFMNGSSGPDYKKIFSTAKTTAITNWKGLESDPSFSPDGKRLAFLTNRDGNFDIWLKDLTIETEINLTPESHANDISPAWSPDGSRIAFASERQIDGVYVYGFDKQSSEMVAENGRYPTWSPSGEKIAFVQERGKDLYVKELESQKSTLIFHSADNDYLIEPTWSNNGRLLAFAKGNNAAWNIHILEIETGRHWPLFDDTYYNRRPIWNQRGDGLFFRSDRGGVNDIWFVEVLEGGREIGDPIPLTFGADVRSFDVAWQGDKIAYSQLRVQDEIYAVDLQDLDRPRSMRQVTNWQRITVDPHIDPSGTKLVMASNSQGNLSLWLTDRDGDNARILYRPTDSCEWPVWSPDGRRVVFVDGDGNEMEIAILEVESGRIRYLTNNDYPDERPSWSPDGKWIVYTRKDPTGRLWIMSSEGDQSRQLTNITSSAGKFSPDGKRIAFTSADDYSYNVWITPTVGGEAKQLTHNEEVGGIGLTWSLDGDWIYYGAMQNGVRNVWRVSEDGIVNEQVTFFNSSINHVRRSTALSTDVRELFFANYENVGDIWLLSNADR